MIYQANTLTVKEVQDGIAELSFCSPNSVNKLDLATLESLDKALDALQNHAGLKGLLLTSDKDSFIVGADITEFLGLFAKTEAELDTWLQFANSIFNKLEDLPQRTMLNTCLKNVLNLTFDRSKLKLLVKPETRKITTFRPASYLFSLSLNVFLVFSEALWAFQHRTAIW